MHAGIAKYWFPLKSVAGKMFPAFPVHAQPAIWGIWQEAHGNSLRSCCQARTSAGDVVDFLSGRIGYSLVPAVRKAFIILVECVDVVISIMRVAINHLHFHSQAPLKERTIMMSSLHAKTFCNYRPLVMGIYRSPLTVDSLYKGPAMHRSNVFFAVNLNKLSNKQSSCRWFRRTLSS